MPLIKIVSCTTDYTTNLCSHNDLSVISGVTETRFQCRECSQVWVIDPSRMDCVGIAQRLGLPKWAAQEHLRKNSCERTPAPKTDNRSASVECVDGSGWRWGVGWRVEVRLVPEREGGYSAYVPRLAGVYSQGETLEEAQANVKEALVGVLSSYLQRSGKIPWRKPTIRKSGEFVRTVLVDYL